MLKRPTPYLVVAGVVIAVGLVSTVTAIRNHSQHPEWSAPAYVELVVLAPYLGVAAILVAIAVVLGKRRGSRK